MTKAFPLEYRLRYLLYGLVYGLGFYAPWERYTSLSFGEPTLWLTLAALPAQNGWLGFSASSRFVLVLACAASVVGAALRIWAAAYRRPAVVKSADRQNSRVQAGGPFRHTRNPLYLGMFLTTLAIALLMPPTGAIVTILLIAVLELRLIGIEEAALAAQFGESYRIYRASVPRLWPSLRPRIPTADACPRWISGIVSELFFVGSAISFLVLGSRYNSQLVLRGILISLGAALIARAALPHQDGNTVQPEPKA